MYVCVYAWCERANADVMTLGQDGGLTTVDMIPSRVCTYVWYVCVCVFVCICMHACGTCASVCLYLCVHTCMRAARAYAWATPFSLQKEDERWWEALWNNIWVYVYVHVRFYACQCECEYMYIRMHVEGLSKYEMEYTHACMYTYMYIHTHIWIQQEKFLQGCLEATSQLRKCLAELHSVQWAHIDHLRVCTSSMCAYVCIMLYVYVCICQAVCPTQMPKSKKLQKSRQIEWMCACVNVYTQSRHTCFLIPKETNIRILHPHNVNDTHDTHTSWFTLKCTQKYILTYRQTHA